MGTNDETPRKLSASKPIRLYQEDDDKIEDLCSNIKDISGLNMQDIIRQAVNAGLPLIMERWKPLIKKKEKE